MATSQKLTDHFLTCPVCFEVFTKACTLVCDHTFCGQCVVSYTKTRPDAISSRSLLCPFCEKLSPVPNPEGPIEEWPGQMKPGLLLRGLLESFGPGSKDTTNCNLCHEEGETTPATVWCSVCDVSLCEACHKAHRRNPASRHHDVSDLSGETKVTRRRKVMCQEHKDECIQFYCKDCKKILCQSCCIIYHRQCKSITSLESMLPEMKTTLAARKDTLMKKIQNEENQVKKRKFQCNDMQQTKSSIQSQIQSAAQSAAQKAINEIKKKEKKLMDELEEVTDKQMGELKADIKTGDMAIQIYRQESEFIDQALNSDSEIDMYSLYQSNESWNVQSEGDEKTSGIKSGIDFSQDIDKMNQSLDSLSLGEIKINRKCLFAEASTPVLSQTVKCRVSGDRGNPNLQDVLHMNVNGTETIIVTDDSNSCVKSFYNRNNQWHHSRLDLQSDPFRLARLDDNKIAITLLYSRQIGTVKVTPDLSFLSYITTSKQYWGLTALTPTTLAGSAQSPPCVDILDKSGNVLQSISPLCNEEKMIQSPYFICTTKKGNILVADTGTKSVLCLTPQGNVVFKYSPTGDRTLNPNGITSTDTGDILVADISEDKVIQLSESGQFVRDILTSRNGINFPYCLDCSKNGSIYVRHRDGNVQVFTFK